MSSKRHTYIRDDFSGPLNRTTDDEIRKLDREYNARIGAVVIVVSVLVAVFLSYAHATSTVSAQWEVDYGTEVVTGATAAEATAACLAKVPTAQPITERITGAVEHACSAPRYVATEIFSANPPPPDGDSDGVPDSTDKCPTVPATTPDGCPATPPPTETWTQCAVERGSCAWTGGTTRQICYAANAAACSDTNATNDRKLERPSPVTCNNATFGNGNSSAGDPAYGTVKACFLSGAVVTPPPTPTLGSARLRWVPPTQNTDNSALTNLAGYWIVYGTNATALTKSVQVSSPSVTAHVIDGLTPGTYYFAVRAYNSAGGESGNSNIVSKVIAP